MIENLWRKGNEKTHKPRQFRNGT